MLDCQVILPVQENTLKISMTSGINLSGKSVGLAAMALGVPALIPIVQFGLVYKLWDKYAMNVHRDHCSNSCWDTVFKAGYETGAGTYKHVYFNATIQTALMWILTLVCIIALYESIKYLINLAKRKQLRYGMALLFLTAIYPHYYGWWVFFGYLNDDFYDQVVHQLFFSTTELMSSLMVLQLSDAGVQVTPARVLLVITIATGHVVASCWDQFINNVLLREGVLHQVLRDVGFMLPDLLHIYLPYLELCRVAESRKISNPFYLISNRMAVMSIGSIVGIWAIAALL